ncbi:MAG: response regulator, partial [Planctomycetota bacterium]
MSHKARLLLLDDEPIKRVVMEDQLREEGFIVDAFDNPLAADDAFANNEYDVILTDIRMPGLDGI